MPKYLRMGDRGPEVRRLQTLLRQLMPGRNLKPDGDFGPATLSAVRAFQTNRNLSPDGIVGNATWSALQPTGAGDPAGQTPADTRPANPPWLDKAITQIGQREIPGSQHNPRITEYLRTTTNISSTYQNRDETAWCSAFVNWCLMQTGTRGTNHALASSWLRWGSSLNQPIPGAITVIQTAGGQTRDAATGSNTGYHVGFWIDENPRHIRLLGGNQGDQVKYSNFFKSSYRVRSYRWPYAPDAIGTPGTLYA